MVNGNIETDQNICSPDVQDSNPLRGARCTVSCGKHPSPPRDAGSYRVRPVDFSAATDRTLGGCAIRSPWTAPSIRILGHYAGSDPAWAGECSDPSPGCDMQEACRASSSRAIFLVIAGLGRDSKLF